MMFDPTDVGIRNSTIEQVSSYKYLGILKDNSLTWKDEMAQRMHFLCRSRLFGVSTEIMPTFFRAVLESLIRYGTVWLSVCAV